MLSVSGAAVLPIETGGAIGPLGQPGLVIAYADCLSVAVAREFLESGASALITKHGSRACHGANLLRVAILEGRTVGWVSGVCVEGSGGARVCKSGLCLVESGSASFNLVAPEANAPLYEFAAGGRVAVCLWSDRRYSIKEFSLQAPGLRASVFDLCGFDARVTRDKVGRIWFETANLDEELLRRLALTRGDSLERLRGMGADYDEIMSRIRDVPLRLVTSSFVEELALRFFSTLLLFHHTYSDVIYEAARRLAPDSEVENVVRLAVAHPVMLWLDGLAIFDDASKQGTAPEWWGVLPDISVAQTVKQHASGLAAGGVGSERFVDAEWLASICVVKEVKMIIAKNLYAALGVVGLVEWGAADPLRGV